MEFRGDFEHAVAISVEAPKDSIAVFEKIVDAEVEGDENTRTKEKSIFKLGELYAKLGLANKIASLLKKIRPFFASLPKAKTAKIVRTLFDLVSTIPETTQIQVDLCKESIEWCKEEKRIFLRQRIESKLAGLLFEQRAFNEALDLISALLREVKRLDDKPLLVEIFLLEARINHELRNLAKMRAALTAARGAANSIYCSPLLQAQLDMESGSLHADEKDYKTGFSYFLESFDAFNSANHPSAASVIKYMYLCKIMTGNVEEVRTVISNKMEVEPTGRDIEAMKAVAKAHTERSLLEFERVLKEYKTELKEDLLIGNHITALYENMLEQNLTRITEPYSRVQIVHIAKLISLPVERVESKLSTMILDKKLKGILDQGTGSLILFENETVDETYPFALKGISHLTDVVTSMSDKASTINKI